MVASAPPVVTEPMWQGDDAMDVADVGTGVEPATRTTPVVFLEPLEARLVTGEWRCGVEHRRCTWSS